MPWGMGQGGGRASSVLSFPTADVRQTGGVGAIVVGTRIMLLKRMAFW